MNTLLTFILAGLILATLFLVSKFCNPKISKISIIITLVIFVLLVQLRYCMSDSFVFVINGKAGEVKFDDRTISTSHDYLQSLLRFGLGCSSIISVAGVFTKNKFFKNVSIFICLPLVLLSTIFVESILDYLLTRKEGMLLTLTWENSTFKFSSFIHTAELILELAIGIVLPLVILFIQKHQPFQSKGELKEFFIFLIPALLMCTPMYVPQSLFGFTSLTIGPFTENQLIYLIFLIAVTAIAYTSFRRRDYDTRYSIMFFICLVAVQFYTQMFTLGHSTNRVAFFQLCNLGNYLLLICVCLKSQKLFDFILIANTLGAIIAFLVPDITAGLFEAWNIHFMYEHSLLLTTPLLFVGLGIFTRPSKKSFKHALIGFSIFFLVCLTVGTIINVKDSNLLGFHHIKANYFYIFDTKKILDVLKPFKWTLKPHIAIGNYYYFYPLWTILFYLVYVIGMFLMYKFFQYIFKVADEHIKLRNHKLKERIEQGKKVHSQPFIRKEGGE